MNPEPCNPPSGQSSAGNGLHCCGCGMASRTELFGSTAYPDLLYAKDGHASLGLGLLARALLLTVTRRVSPTLGLLAFLLSHHGLELGSAGPSALGDLHLESPRLGFLL